MTPVFYYPFALSWRILLALLFSLLPESLWRSCMYRPHFSLPTCFRDCHRILMEGCRTGDELPGSKVDTCSEATLNVNDYRRGELAKMGWWIGSYTVTIKVAMLLEAQIRFFWATVGCNHLVMSACLLFWVLTYFQSARCLQNNSAVNTQIICVAGI